MIHVVDTHSDDDNNTNFSSVSFHIQIIRTHLCCHLHNNSRVIYLCYYVLVLNINNTRVIIVPVLMTFNNLNSSPELVVTTTSYRDLSPR